MTTTRRDFIKQAALLSAAGALAGSAASIRRALAIEPAAGTTFYDAEHVVILMQENRSFDHLFGTLRGVRGFGDPRAIRLPDGNPVWAQPDQGGQRFLPFRLGIDDSRATWMGALPHSWADQVDARNGGRYDRWIDVKRSGSSAYAPMPLTMGYYTRDDLPFYYELADAFTVCDQNFCSCLTGTTPNRLHLWTGTARAAQSEESPALVYNSDVDYGRWASWTTFPERLEEAGVSWKVYQNEISLESGLSGEHDAWLANFTDNPLEWFTQFNVRFAKAHREYVERRLRELPDEIAAAETSDQPDRERQLRALRSQLERFRAEQPEFSEAGWQALSDRQRRLHERAFHNNASDLEFRQLAELTYSDAGETRRVPVPKGDILHNFRTDVREGRLPTVSWLVPPERVSDHPGSAWYGAWYLSEVLDILTSNPRVWQKTIFILTYDENDGYFDHVPPFVAPDPRKPETGRVSQGIDAGLEQVSLESDRVLHGDDARESPIGLGYRVPMIIASPWSRGGYVCSQVFDHTSTLQFLEKLLAHRTGRRVEEPNINTWRRTVCGDLTSAFDAGDTRATARLTALDRDRFVERVHKAQFKEPPSGYRALSPDELQQLRQATDSSRLMPQQEAGQRPARALPYELFVTDARDASGNLVLRFEARNALFGGRAAGAPFTVYSRVPEFSSRNYTVGAGSAVEDVWQIGDVDGGRYHLAAYGPNGFFREFIGHATNPALMVSMLPATAGVAAEVVEVHVRASAELDAARTLRILDNSYGNRGQEIRVGPGESATVRVPVKDSHGWFDLSVTSPKDAPFERRLAGRIETGVEGSSDPLLSRST